MDCGVFSDVRSVSVLVLEPVISHPQLHYFIYLLLLSCAGFNVTPKNGCACFVGHYQNVSVDYIE